MEKITKPVKEKIDNTALVEGFRARGGRILHINRNNQRNMTLAFIPKSNRIEVATAVTHSNDTFTKKIGTKTAIEHFNEGKTVFLPLREKHVISELLGMFY